MRSCSRVSPSPDGLHIGDSHNVDSTVIRSNNDLTVQLNSRKEKISFLIKFINENGVLSKVCTLVFVSR
jgi:hypothetical protein